MTEREITRDEINKALFSQLVVMFATSAMQQMGKLMNPVTKKVEVSLEGAEATIELLDMLEAKTKGNLDADEERLLKDTLMSLKLNFVELMEKTPGMQTVPGEGPADQPAAEQPKPPEGEDKGPKFHKKYE
jgi:hypothetical protein